MNKNVLKDLWSATHNKSGWLSSLSLVLSEAEINYLVDLDDAHQEAMRVMQAAWRTIPKPKPEVDEAWARAQRLEYLNEQLAGAKSRLINVRLEGGRLALKGRDAAAAFVGTFEVDCAVDIHKFRELIARVEMPQPVGEDALTQDMIEKAREVRIEVLKRPELTGKKIRCPFHGDDKHPSASVSRGFFKCFTCGKRLDAIGWLMEVDGKSFHDAVRQLLRLEIA